ncbi:MAG: GyrI-like domain-containing protein [Candidatus Onthomonas sp.]
MNYRLEQLDAFTVIGFERVISNQTAYRDCPAFWQEYQDRYMFPLLSRGVPQGDLEQAIWDNRIGEFGVCVCLSNDSFRYLIAGTYQGGPVPEGLTLFSFPASLWAKFTAKGPMPQAIQALNTQLFSEFLPSHPEWELSMGVNVEWYSMEDTAGADYESGIWLPIRQKR